MRMMDELKPLFLYSASKKVYVPIDEKDRKKGSAILLLTPSMEVSSQLMKLPYLVNPMIYKSFYIDRNVMAYIEHVPEDVLEFDQTEEEALSEAMISSFGGKTKIKFDDATSMMDMRYLKKTYTSDMVKNYAALLGMGKIPEEITVKVYPNLNALRDSYHGKSNKEKLYYYVREGMINIVSALSYDDQIMYGPYEMYLATAMASCLMATFNMDLSAKIVYAIAANVSGLAAWSENNTVDFGDEGKILKVISRMTEREGYRGIAKYIHTADARIFARFIIGNDIRVLRKIFTEGLSYSERQRLLPSQFGIPNKRKYPIHDEEHVRLAIKMFNSCDADEEEELAENIIKQINKFGMTDIKVSAANRFRKFYEKSKIYSYTCAKSEVTKESAIEDNPECANFEDIKKICSTLSSEELRRITFSNEYNNSPFIIKRIIHRVDGNPAGFLDVYKFPSNPNIAQITLAVSSDYRDMGVASAMVKEMLGCDLALKHNFNTYYWTAHKDNLPSQYLATNNGFEDTHGFDKYGRKIFVKYLDRDLQPIIPIKPDTRFESEMYATDSMVVTENMAIFSEGDESMYSKRLRKYLYQERLRNSRQVMQYYEKVKTMNPNISRTYPRLDMYRGLNLFVDLSYYHALFLKSIQFKLDKAVNFYFEFINRLINNKELSATYKKQTIFIPIDPGVWPVQPMSDLYDFKKNLNPISIIFRLVRTNPEALRKAWGNKDIIFVGTRGYFKVDFKTFEMKNLPRFKINLRKLMSNEPVVDDFENDELADDDKAFERNDIRDTHTAKAAAIRMIDRAENELKIDISDVRSINAPVVVADKNDGTPKSDHLQMSIDPIKLTSSGKNGNVIITIDPDGPNGYDKLINGAISNLTKVGVYCMPNPQ